MKVSGTSSVVGLAGSVNSTGTGIAFPSAQAASTDPNTLDDYEEGTFTPTVIGTTTAGVGTYSTQIGKYTKVGRQVTVLINCTWSAHTGTGNLRLAGLPVTPDDFYICAVYQGGVDDSRELHAGIQHRTTDSS